MVGRRVSLEDEEEKNRGGCGRDFCGGRVAVGVIRSAWLPANLIQAQRDYFGAHTYERIDAEGAFHTEWEKE